MPELEHVVPTAVLIGNFDGVHRGHQRLLSAAAERARRLVVVTFWPHPMSVIRPDKAPRLLTDLQTRVRLLAEAGADEVVTVAFDDATSELTPEQFVDTVLLPLHPDLIMVGENFRFGHRAAGDVATLTELGAGRFAVTGLPLASTEGEPISSTRIRKALAAGEVAAAADLLGRPYCYTGTVVQGFQRGRELGFPTANLPVPDWRAAPADGVYAGWARRVDEPDAERWPAAISVGTNPTFDDVMHTVVEAYVLGRDDLELYDVPLEVEFVERLRGQVAFTGLDALIEQMRADVVQCREVLGQA
ncbi:bifunctional riboflavin kinase/FAD synthetase [Naumannella halotolerans]|uniref:Riboflavin biosynthesis protein n=1 Tax=Naumannella halotolerans TaxID=993414 RepID=A0A4R7J6B9_9ACTN|nr:bifunctional riboflavin kinase/FAD synthetase [Naumannella halotolerans]TDT32920.1 riboflavin kinase/FMN adenylyltransferase [Naumannella halotolerans]